MCDYIQWPFPVPTPAPIQWGQELCDAMFFVYDKVVHWKCNFFQVPSGSSGKALVLEISHLYRAYADLSSLESLH